MARVDMPDAAASREAATGPSTGSVKKRRPGRPPSYIFEKPDDQLSELERRLKMSVLKRRLRQNRSYHRRKLQQLGKESRTSAVQQKLTQPECSEHVSSEKPSQASSAGKPEPVCSERVALPPSLAIKRENLLSKGTGGPGSVSCPIPEIPPRSDSSIAASLESRPLHPNLSTLSASPSPADAFLTDLDDNDLGSSISRVKAARSVPGTAATLQELAVRDAMAGDAPALTIHGLSGMAVNETTPEEWVDGEEDFILSELVNIETSSSIASSNAMFQMGASALFSTIQQLPPLAKVAAHSFCIFPESFDFQAAHAVLGGVGDAASSIPAIHPLLASNLLVFVGSTPETMRFSLNPLAKLLIPRALLGGKSGRLKPALDDSIEDTDCMFAESGLFASNVELFGQDEQHEQVLVVLRPMELVQRRYVAHFGKLLAELSDSPVINRDGSERRKAMRAFSRERGNILHALRLSAEMGNQVRLDFLRKGAAVMRYCTDAKMRCEVFKHAIEAAPEASSYVTLQQYSKSVKPGSSTTGKAAVSEVSAGTSNDTGFGEDDRGDGGQMQVPSSPFGASASNAFSNLQPADLRGPLSGEAPSAADWMSRWGVELPAVSGESAECALVGINDQCTVWKNCGRVHLALGEAFLDLLDIDQAEGPLERAQEIMDARNRRPECSVEAVSVALTNLLLAEIKTMKGNMKEARKLLYYALSILSGAGMTESTFTVNAMNTLVAVHLKDKCYDQALSTCHRMIDVLVNLGYEGMPIYADAIGTLATVHLNTGDAEEAEQYYCVALDMIRTWFARSEWNEGVPYEHCQDLDIWLLEGLSKAHSAQGNMVQAQELYANAQERRAQRGLIVSTRFDSSRDTSGVESSVLGQHELFSNDVAHAPLDVNSAGVNLLFAASAGNQTAREPTAQSQHVLSNPSSGVHGRNSALSSSAIEWMPLGRHVY